MSDNSQQKFSMQTVHTELATVLRDKAFLDTLEKCKNLKEKHDTMMTISLISPDGQVYAKGLFSNGKFSNRRISGELVWVMNADESLEWNFDIEMTSPTFLGINVGVIGHESQVLVAQTTPCMDIGCIELRLGTSSHIGGCLVYCEVSGMDEVGWLILHQTFNNNHDLDFGEGSLNVLRVLLHNLGPERASKITFSVVGIIFSAMKMRSMIELVDGNKEFEEQKEYFFS